MGAIVAALPTVIKVGEAIVAASSAVITVTVAYFILKVNKDERDKLKVTPTTAAE